MRGCRRGCVVIADCSDCRVMSYRYASKDAGVPGCRGSGTGWDVLVGKSAGV